MFTKFGILMIAVCAYSTNALPSCGCTRNRQPVCGTDGVTYSNQCLLECHSAQVDYPGECGEPPQPDCICTEEYRPVCGSDGKTYGNACELNCATAQNSRLSIAYDGKCLSDNLPIPPDCICTMNYRPVCGSDGKTYGNACELNCATAQNSRLSIAYDGKCLSDNLPIPPDCICTMNYRPVCGSDGKTYGNACELNCATAQNSRLSIAYDGKCLSDSPSQPFCICTLEYRPVCGSDAKTYGNACELNCATAQNSRLSIAYDGKCLSDSPPQPDCICTLEFKPVCGSDGKTYGNACELNCATAQNSRLSIAYDGKCLSDNLPIQPDCICTMDYRPVCGSDGKTYGNACQLNCATANNPSLSVARQGRCLSPVIVAEPEARGLSPVDVAEPEARLSPVDVAESEGSGLTPVNVAESEPQELTPVDIAEPESRHARQVSPVNIAGSETQLSPVDVANTQLSPVNIAGSEAQLTPVDVANTQLSPVNVANSQLSPINVANSQLSPINVAQPEASGLSPVNVAEPEARHKRQISPVNVANRPLSPVNVANPGLSPINVANRPLSPVNVANPGLSPVNIANRPLSPVNVASPALSPVNVANRPLSPVNVANPALSPINVANRPLSPVNVANPPLSPINVANPPLSPINVANPPLSPINIANPPLSPINVANRPLSPVNVANRPLSSVNIARTG